MIRKNLLTTTMLATILLLNGCATTEEGKAAQSGAVGGALVGLFVGALTGDERIAARATVAGAAYGATIGYTQSREDQRTRMIAEAIGGAKAGETADQAGVRHLQDFLGDWNVAIWVLDENGSRIEATGTALGSTRSQNSVNVDFENIVAKGVDPFTLSSMASYSENKGFVLSSKIDGEDAGSFVGEYVAADNKFIFYYTGADATARIEVRIATAGLIISETWMTIDGRDVQIESVRMTRA